MKHLVYKAHLGIWRHLCRIFFYWHNFMLGLNPLNTEEILNVVSLRMEQDKWSINFAFVLPTTWKGLPARSITFFLLWPAPADSTVPQMSSQLNITLACRPEATWMVSSFVDEKKPVPEAPWKSRKWCIAQKSGLTPSVDYLIWGVAAKQKKKKIKQSWRYRLWKM